VPASNTPVDKDLAAAPKSPLAAWLTVLRKSSTPSNSFAIKEPTPEAALPKLKLL
jgi:hypothetical protein